MIPFYIFNTRMPNKYIIMWMDMVIPKTLPLSEERYPLCYYIMHLYPFSLLRA